MKIKNLFLLSLLLLVACVAQDNRNFERMSEAELFEYNRSVSAMDQIFCTEQVNTGSHIRKRSCRTVYELISGQPTTLDTPSSSSSIIYGSN